MRNCWGWEGEEILFKMSFVIPGSFHWVALVPTVSLRVVIVAFLDSSCLNYHLRSCQGKRYEIIDVEARFSQVL